MGRTWLRGTGKHRRCYAGLNSNCYSFRLKYPSPEDLPAPELPEATDIVNRILEEVAKKNPDPNRELAIVAFQDADGEDYLQLAYIDVSVPSGPNYDEATPNYDEATSSRSDKNH